MDHSASGSPAPPSSRHDPAGSIVATSAVIAVLYFGRDVLVPVTLAVILSLLLAPLVRIFRRVGFGQTVSVLTAVLGLTLAVGAVAAVIGVQVVKMTSSLPRYEQTIRHKLETLNELTVGRLEMFNRQAGRFINPSATPQGAAAPARALGRPNEPTAAQPQPAPLQPAKPALAAPGGALALPATPGVAVPIPVEVHEPRPSSLIVLQKVLGSIWAPLEMAGIVLFVLVFVMLEHESLRDRFIRIAGGADIHATTLALIDAGERLSRFFVSQFWVNFGVGCAVWIGLALIGLPQSLLWGTLTGVLRFVPYVGVWIAGLFAILLASAVDPGWSLVIATLSIYVVVELIAGQVVEPQLYGHATGLSPLSVVVAAIFWSWLWGPIGLIVSTPLTLCLVVAGRHIKALSVLDILLGDTQALTLQQRFYQRALSGDSLEIIRSARMFLNRNSFAAYCDLVLIPALFLGRLDLDAGAITAEQQAKVRDVIVSVIGAIGGEGRKFSPRRTRTSVLDEGTIGHRLRREREEVFGPFQGPLTVPPGSIVICVGLRPSSDDLITELLVRILRDQKVDARHMSIEDLRQPLQPDAIRDSVSVVYLVSAFPCEERGYAESVAQLARGRFTSIRLVTMFLPGKLSRPGAKVDTIRSADEAADSFRHAVHICLDMQKQDTTSGAPAAT